MLTFNRSAFSSVVLGFVILVSTPVLTHAQYASTLFERIERIILQNEREWILVNESAYASPHFRTLKLEWQLDKKDVRDQRVILVWMEEFQNPEEAAREFYNLSPSPQGQAIPQLPIADKCYQLSSHSLLLRKGNLIARLAADDRIPGPINVLIRFARDIAYVVPSQPSMTGNQREENKKEVALHLKQGEAKLKEGRYEQAVEEFKKAIELDPDSADAHHLLGLAYLKTDTRVRALEELREAIRLRPEWVEAHYDLARAYYDFGDYKNAASSFEEAIRLRPDFFAALIDLGATYQHSGLHTKSAEVLRRAVLLRPDHLDAKVALGNALLLSAQPQEAIEVLEQVVRLSPENALAYSLLGEAYRSLGKFQEALTALNQALRISPEDSVALNYLGMLFESLDRQQDAMAAYKQAIAAKPDYAGAHYNLALLLLSLNDMQQAEQEYDVLKSLDSDLAETLLRKLRRMNP